MAGRCFGNSQMRAERWDAEYASRRKRERPHWERDTRRFAGVTGAPDRKATAKCMTTTASPHTLGKGSTRRDDSDATRVSQGNKTPVSNELTE